MKSASDGSNGGQGRTGSSDADLVNRDVVVGNRNPVVWMGGGALLGAALLYASMRKADLGALTGLLGSADLRWGAVVLIATICFVAIKTWRWGLLLRFIPDVRFQSLQSAVYAGLAVNFLLSHAGEFLRAGLVAQRTRASFVTVVASVVVERALDFVAFLCLLAILPLVSPDLSNMVKVATTVTGGIVLCSIIGLYLLIRPPGWLNRMAAAFGRMLPDKVAEWCVTQIDMSRTGLYAIRDWRLILLAIGVSILQWALIVLAIWSSVVAIGGFPTLAGSAATFVLIVVGLTLPNSPMQLGTTQLAFAIGLGTAGIPATAAVAASLVYTALVIIPIMVGGTVCLLRLNILPNLKLR